MRTTIALVALLSGTAVPAQDPPPARAFHPADFEFDAVVELDKLRDLEVLGVLERGIGKLVLTRAGEQLGVDFEDIERLRFVGRWNERQTGDFTGTMLDVVTLLEGANLALPGPDALKQLRREARRGQVGRYPVVITKDYGGEEILVSTRPGLVVRGPADHVEAVLAGRAHGGVPRPELLALTAGKPPLAQVAFGRFGRDLEWWRRQTPFPKDWFDADDPLEMMMFRFEQVDADRFRASMVLRFAHGKDGLLRFREELQATFTGFVEHKQLGFMKKLWRALKVERRDRDLVVSHVTGTARQTSALLGQLMPMLAMGWSLGSEAQAGEVLIEDVGPAEPPPPPAKGDKKKD